MRMNKKIIIIGHPRSGTGYASRLLKTAGLDVGHEFVGKHGISSWQWAVEPEEAFYGDGYRDIGEHITIALMREPRDIVPSVAYTEWSSQLWRAQYVDIPPVFNPVYQAMCSIYEWNKICHEKADYIVQLPRLADFFKTVLDLEVDDSLPPQNVRQHPKVDEFELFQFKLYNQMLEQYAFKPTEF